MVKYKQRKHKYHATMSVKLKATTYFLVKRKK